MVRTMSARLRRSFADRQATTLSIRGAGAPSVQTVSLIQSALVIGLALVAMLDASYNSSTIAPLLGAAAVVTALYILSASMSARAGSQDTSFDHDGLDNAAQVALIKERVSHDLRTPLNAVIGFSEIMQREVLGPVGNERYREYAGHIRKSAEHFQSTTEKTLAVTALLAAPAKAKPERFDLSAWASRHHNFRPHAKQIFVSSNRDSLDQALEHLQDAAATIAKAANCSCATTITLKNRFHAQLHIDLHAPGIAALTDANDALPGFDLNLLLAKLATQAAGGTLVVGTQDNDRWRATVTLPIIR